MSEKLDLEYHNRCKEICKFLDITLYGTSLDHGFSYYLNREGKPQYNLYTYEMPHCIMEKIETLVLNQKENNS